MISPVTTLRVPQAAIEVTPTTPNRMQQNDWCKVGSSNQPEDINGGYRCRADFEFLQPNAERHCTFVLPPR